MLPFKGFRGIQSSHLHADMQICRYAALRILMPESLLFTPRSELIALGLWAVSSIHTHMWHGMLSMLQISIDLTALGLFLITSILRRGSFLKSILDLLRLSLPCLFIHSLILKAGIVKLPDIYSVNLLSKM